MLCSRVQRWSFARSRRNRGWRHGRQGLGCPRPPPADELPRHFDHRVWLTRACKSPAFIRKFCSSSGWGIDDDFPDREFSCWLDAGDGARGFVWAATASAYTPEQEQACTSDAFRLCSSEIPDVDRVTACMVAKKSQLSPPAGRSSGLIPSPAGRGRAGRQADGHQAGHPAQVRQRQAEDQEAGEKARLDAERGAPFQGPVRATD